MDPHHRLQRERIHLLLIGDARRGFGDIAAARTQDADAAFAGLQGRRIRCAGAADEVGRPLAASRKGGWLSRWPESAPAQP